MRWIFVTLVLLNLLYFGWGYWQQAQLEPEPEKQAIQIEPVLPGEELVLLTERLPQPASPAPPHTIASEKPKIQPPQLPVHTKEPERKICARIGPYSNQIEGRGLVKQLEESGFQAALSETEEEKSYQHWVILPPVDSRRRALQTLRELQARKIDSYLVSSGEMKNAISLGLFSRDELAKGVQEKIREAGYPAEIRPKEKLEKTFWVQMIAKQPFENARKVLDSLIPARAGIKITNTPCEMFAQSI